MKTKMLIFLAALLSIAASDSPRAKFTIKALDEQGNPMANALVTIVFTDPETRQRLPQENLTNADGVATAEGFTDGAIGGMITKEGYYRSGWRKVNFSGLENGRWQPWNDTYVSHLRPIVNPVPMYAKRGWIEIPSADVPCGYDLEKSDWVAPYGKGVVGDLIFLLSRRYINRQDFDVSVTMTFGNKLDGIQPAEMPEIGRYSEFKWLRQAPDAGYSPTLETRFKNAPNSRPEQTASPEQMYFFRVRTMERDGHMVNANYGKIKGGLRLAPFNSKTCKVDLTYYFNPTLLDRNMEWDIKHNLIPELQLEETPREP